MLNFMFLSELSVNVPISSSFPLNPNRSARLQCQHESTVGFPNIRLILPKSQVF
jgi:hypothetical protein